MNDEAFEVSHPIRLQSVGMVFEGPNDIYDDDWASSVHIGNGFLFPHEEVQVGSIISVYGVSVFHQLHCINKLQKLYNRATQGELEDSAHDMHAFHCFNYLRQGILCAADATLEQEFLKIESLDSLIALSNQSLKGVGDEHRCRDALPLWEATKKSYAAFKEALQSST